MESTVDLKAYMTDTKGRLVLASAVKDEDKLEDDLVKTLIAQAMQLHKALEIFKSQAFTDLRAFLDLISEKYGVTRGGQKGGITLTSYDGTLKVQISVQDFISFGAQLQIAKELVDQCIREWGHENANKHLQTLVEHAFRVDKNNRINVQNILGLKRLNIQDDTWRKAMQAIDDSIRVEASKEYIRFYKRPSPEAEWAAITLDLAKA